MPPQRRDTAAQLPEELADLERVLASFEPEPSRIDRARLMFDAGVACGLSQAQASGDGGRDTVAYEKRRKLTTRTLGSESGARSKLPPWPIATAAAVLLACLFGSLYIVERNRAPTGVREIVYLQRETPQPADTVAASGGQAPAPPHGAHAPSPFDRAGFQSDFAARTTSHDPQYLVLRQLILTRGVDSLPQRDYTDDTSPLSELTRPPATSRRLMKELLDSPAA